MTPATGRAFSAYGVEFRHTVGVVARTAWNADWNADLRPVLPVGAGTVAPRAAAAQTATVVGMAPFPARAPEQDHARQRNGRS